MKKIDRVKRETKQSLTSFVVADPIAFNEKIDEVFANATTEHLPNGLVRKTLDWKPVMEFLRITEKGA